MTKHKSRRQLLALTRKEPDNADLLSQVAASYFEEKKYKKAYEYDRLAWMLNRKNAIHLANLAADLGMMGWYEKSITLSKGIISWSLDKICKHSGVEIDRAKSIKNDCRFRISVMYFLLKQPAMARRYLNLYLKIKKRDKLTTYVTKDKLKGHWEDLNLHRRVKML